ncbi:MAG: 2-dehydropantoate 2-reductase [Candidatus Sedimenticola endophacoides]|uniref:2-dehydropantoate 2-reductase n=1 Tax=Candidatus Sedimenticola endophacoides TaxID=2548426 RepID=A0A657PN37_9GAMM|nr:MAG: 2-dehydropantoate 2-reductase [Candidatus Sedimenticola endophacoides]OQX33642.1 MAG: 2-dehydropantoate 2-reductase [Candidatus Sedimenticola endophacoides]OQX34596.1 MAG: 2-dehydropantoate 2-reductase [Candidatus Sedimenticola endophacoides]OQX39446.1 MAG: 2-dehydropantoate 2-reductase [Candidatus Sedimenticola endophacoides]PUD98650.1 MAG: 2-dehydropantoate 2-reductase [Candidatus Sedimenticola endophacoides]
MRLLILGAGAVGLSLAARLSPHCQVHAVCRPQHAARITREGFTLRGIWGGGRYRFAAGPEAPQGVTFDYCLITCKSQQTRAVCEQYRKLLGNCEVVSLHNGIGNEEIIGEYTARVIGGTIITGFEWRDNAEVEVTVEAGPIRLGRFPEGLDPAVQRLVGLFQAAGLNVEGSDTIRANLWAKTLYNCALNPLGAITGVAYGELADVNAWRVIERVVAEAHAVSVAEGAGLPWPTPGAYLDYLREVQLPATAGHHSSMLQDLRRGRETEIDFINGAVSRLGRRHTIATPANDMLVDMIRFQSGRRPTPSTEGRGYGAC